MDSLEISNIHCSENINKNYLNYIPVLNAETLTYDEFFKNYLLQNQACIIKNISKSWESTRLWTDNNQNILNLDYLQSKYGNEEVIVYNCNEKYYNSQKTLNYQFNDYLEYLKKIKSDKNQDEDILYLKDWHLKNANPHDNFYEVPIFFASDWLNEYLVENQLDDYRFVYIGPKNSWTPFHADVFSSYSWSTNIVGEKQWILFTPGQEETLKDKFNNLPYSIDLNDCNISHFKVIQEPGDAIFVPSGWYHQVWNTKCTISINHNWVNGCNLKTVYEALIGHLSSIKLEIQDCSDMDNFLHHCQIMLKASFGMDFCDFIKFLEYISTKRQKGLIENESIILFNKYCLERKHIQFDLLAIKEVLAEFSFHEDVNYLVTMNYIKNPNDLLTKIINTLNKI